LPAISEGDVRASLDRHVGRSAGAPVPGEYLAGLEEARDAELGSSSAASRPTSASNTTSTASCLGTTRSSS
jgi:hypothetical protein